MKDLLNIYNPHSPHSGYGCRRTMTTLQIFAAIFIVALIAGWVIIADALRDAPMEEEIDTTKIHDGNFN